MHDARGIIVCSPFAVSRKYFSPAFRFARMEEPSRPAEQVSIFVGSCKHGIAASSIVGKFFSRGSLLDASMELGDKQKTK